MSNSQHVEMLSRGVLAWNEWRRTNPHSHVDLAEANLVRANLGGIDLSGALLTRARFDGSNLFLASFQGSDLRGASLSRAILAGANMQRADLRGADLTEVQFHDGDAEAADLSGANLTGAKVTREGEGDSFNGFLELGASVGLESVNFGDSVFLLEYLRRALEYIRDPEVPESRRYPKFFESAVSRLKALDELIPKQEPAEAVVQLVREVSEELLVYLQKNPAALYNLAPRRFEELVAELLAGFGWQVEISVPTRDRGYDIFAVSRDISGIRTSWIVECKRYRPDRLVGVEVVQSLYGVKNMTRAANALLATTSHFSRGVHAFKASRWDLELRDYEGILDWLNAYHPNPAGRLHLRDNRLVREAGSE